jgi:O-antigen/teichoic acid export membrane protein
MLSKIPTHLVVAFSSWISRIITAVVQIICVRILTESLGLDQYAVFALVTGLLGWYALSDFGLGISLQNHISEERARNHSYESLITSALYLAIIFLAITALLLYFLSPLLSEIIFKNFEFLSEFDKNNIFFTTGILYIAASIGAISFKIWYAEQKGYVSNILPAVASIFSIMGVLYVDYLSPNNKLYWSLVGYIAPSSLIAMGALIYKTFPMLLSKKINFVSNPVFLLKRAMKFWLFAVLAVFVLQIDYIVMSQHVSSDQIVVYNILTKLFTLIFFVYNSVLAALWPVFAESLALNKWLDMIQYLKRYIVLGILYILVATVVLILLIDYFVYLLTQHSNLNIPTSLIILAGIYFAVRVWTDTFAMVLQSANELKYFWIWVPVQAIISVAFQWTLSEHFGIYGILWGLIISFSLTVAWVLPYVVFGKIKKNATGC